MSIKFSSTYKKKKSTKSRTLFHAQICRNLPTLEQLGKSDSMVYMYYKKNQGERRE